MASTEDGPKVAILGGDGRPIPGQPTDARIFLSSRYGGNGEIRRLLRALRSGTIDKLIILVSWNGHSETGLATRLCRRLKIPVVRLA